MLDDKSIEEIEGAFLDDRGNDEWPLVRRVLAARKKLLRDLTTEDLRLLIGQKVALEILVPRAIAVLEANPLAEGDLYPGDLLENVLSIPRETWLTIPHERQVLEAIVKQLDVDAPKGLPRSIRNHIKEFLKDGRTT